jgi:hypothetical protein
MQSRNWNRCLALLVLSPLYAAVVLMMQVLQLSSEDLSSMTGSWINAGELLGATNGNITVVHPSFFRQLAQVGMNAGNYTPAAVIGC